MQSEIKQVIGNEGPHSEVGTAELLAAASYLTDVTLTGCTYHSWRVALVAQKLAEAIAPQIRRDVFYAALMHDIGTIGAEKQMQEYISLQDQLSDAHIRTHSERGAALLEQIPGMATAAKFIRCHHEYWDGKGYPSGMFGDNIPLGAQIIRIADEATSAGCFVSAFKLADGLGELASLTHKDWSKQLWEALVRSTADAAFYRSLISEDALPDLITETLTQIAPPPETITSKSIELIYHIFATLTDAKDISKAGHALRVARTAHALARELKLSDEECMQTYHAGLVHDCGWVAITDGILPYSGRLSQEELDIVRQHADTTIRILGCLPSYTGMVELGNLAGSHHEWLDGNGYPNQLTAKDLHIITRVLSVADAFDGMVSASNYRILSVKGALNRLHEGIGSQFDPEVVAALKSITDSGELQPETAIAA